MRHLGKSTVFMATILLCSLFVSDQPEVRGEEVSARDIETLAPSELLDRLEILSHGPEKPLLIEALSKKRSESLPVLRRLAVSGRERQRLFSLQMLATMNDERATTLALQSLRGTTVKVQRRAASVLMQLKAREAYGPLLLLLVTSKDTGVVKSALAALGAIGNADATSVIRQYLGHENDSVCVNAAIALAALGSEEGIEIVLSKLKSPDLQAQREATFGLGFFSDPRAQTAAASILEGPRDRWKTEARIALARLEVQAAGPENRVAVLRELVVQRNDRVGAWCIDQLCEVGTESAYSALEEISNSATWTGTYAQTRLLGLGVKTGEE